jgi:hypothetical protein
MYIDPVAATWQKSSFCNGASSCVELAWVTSSRCNNGSCVQVACCEGEVWVRDSKLGEDSPVLRFTVGSWWSYIAAVKTRQLGTYGGPVLLTRSAGEPWRMWHERDWFTALEFTDAEVDAFVAGINGGEFDPDVLASGVHDTDEAGRARPSAPSVAASGADSVPR